MDWFPLQGYDLFMLILLIAVTIFGAVKGMAWQVASLASLILSAIAAVHLGEPLAPYFGREPPLNRFVAMLVVYLVTSLVIWLIFRIVSGLIDRLRLQEFDRQLGAIFGLIKAVLLCMVITFFAVTLSEQSRQAVLRSWSGYYAAALLQKASPLLPEQIRGVLGGYLEEFQRRLSIPGEAPPWTPPPSPPAPAQRPPASTI